MAVVYELEWRPTLPLARVTGVLAGVLDAHRVDDHTLRVGALSITVGPLGQLSREVADEIWGIPAEMSAHFRIRNNISDEEYEDAVRHIVLASVTLACGEDLDALLLLNMERLLMRRDSGLLTIYSAWTHWAGFDLLPLLPTPYRSVAGPLPLA